MSATEPESDRGRARGLLRPLGLARWKLRRRLAERRDPTLGWLLPVQRRDIPPDEADARIWDIRRRLVRQLAPGKSFIDVGGMYGVAGEVAFLAEQAGATRVVLFDGMDPTEEFDRRHRERSSGIQYFQGDLHDGEELASLGQFDVVWCTGVLYHSPHPMLQLLNLRRITGERLVLGTHTAPELAGIEQACVFYPGVSERSQAAYATVHGGPERFPGMAGPFDATPLMAYANMWWGVSPSALRSMLHFSGFETLEEHPSTSFWIDVVAAPGGQPTDIYPPPGQSRERVRRRYADTPDDRLPAYAEAQLRQIGR